MKVRFTPVTCMNWFPAFRFNLFVYFLYALVLYGSFKKKKESAGFLKIIALLYNWTSGLVVRANQVFLIVGITWALVMFRDRCRYPFSHCPSLTFTSSDTILPFVTFLLSGSAFLLFVINCWFRSFCEWSMVAE